jgi:peptide/nickel transport system permease protein
MSTAALEIAGDGLSRSSTRRRPPIGVGVVIVGINLILAALGPIIAPYDPQATGVGPSLVGPSLSHPFGTDQVGMDIFSRVIAAPRTDLTIAVCAVAISVVIGVLLGLVAATAGRLVTGSIMRFADVAQSLPVFITAMALVAFSGQNVRNVVIALGFVLAPQFLRLTRNQALLVKSRPYVEAARVAGTPARRVLLRHVLPNSIGPSVVHASVLVGFSILLTSGLSFIGAGVREPTPEWGSMIASAAPNFITGSWWTSVFPGVALAVTVMGWALLGEQLARMLGTHVELDEQASLREAP